MSYKRQIAYLRYVVKHKWFVYLAALHLAVKDGAPLGLFPRALLHDLSKFRPSEWVPYAECFYDESGNKRCVESEAFVRAWNSHQKVNKHHWQYWLIMMDSGVWKPLEMPEVYAYEMVADWMGAGRAITGKWEAEEWYRAHRNSMFLHEKTRILVERLL